MQLQAGQQGRWLSPSTRYIMHIKYTVRNCFRRHNVASQNTVLSRYCIVNDTVCFLKPHTSNYESCSPVRRPVVTASNKRRLDAQYDRVQVYDWCGNDRQVRVFSAFCSSRLQWLVSASELNNSKLPAWAWPPYCHRRQERPVFAYWPPRHLLNVGENK